MCSISIFPLQNCRQFYFEATTHAIINKDIGEEEGGMWLGELRFSFNIKADVTVVGNKYVNFLLPQLIKCN